MDWASVIHLPSKIETRHSVHGHCEGTMISCLVEGERCK